MCFVVKRGRWRDYAVASGLFVLLFHTSVLAFVGLGLISALVVPFVVHQPRIGRKLSLSAVIVAVGTIPWVVYVDFLSAASNRPMGRSLLSAVDLLQYPLDRLPYVLIAGGTIAVLLSAGRLRGTVSDRFLDLLVSHRAVFLFLSAWALFGNLLFVALVPAASYFVMRLTLVIFVPSILFGAMLFASVGRIVWPRHSSVAGSALFVLVLASTGKTTFWPPIPHEMREDFVAFVDYLRALDIGPGTRLYTASTENLALRFYTGMPFQNVMPVRKEFLDAYERELIIIESSAYEGLTGSEVQRVLAGRASSMTDEQARQLAGVAFTRTILDNLENRVSVISTPVPPQSDLLPLLVDHTLQKTADTLRRDIPSYGNPTFDGYDIRDFKRLAEVFFFRFVNVEARTGMNLNYAARARTATATLLPGGRVLLRIPARAESPAVASPER
jgi:hypothetical protein